MMVYIRVLVIKEIKGDLTVCPVDEEAIAVVAVGRR